MWERHKVTLNFPRSTQQQLFSAGINYPACCCSRLHKRFSLLIRYFVLLLYIYIRPCVCRDSPLFIGKKGVHCPTRRKGPVRRASGINQTETFARLLCHEWLVPTTVYRTLHNMHFRFDISGFFPTNRSRGWCAQRRICVGNFDDDKVDEDDFAFEETTYYGLRSAHYMLLYIPAQTYS